MIFLCSCFVIHIHVNFLYSLLIAQLELANQYLFHKYGNGFVRLFHFYELLNLLCSALSGHSTPQG